MLSAARFVSSYLTYLLASLQICRFVRVSFFSRTRAARCRSPSLARRSVRPFLGAFLK